MAATPRRPDHIAVLSAGSEPAAQISPMAVEAMRGVGIDIINAVPQLLSTEAIQASHVVVTMGCGDACPFFPGKSYKDWKLTDPAGQPLEAVRQVRDEIRTHVEQLVADLLPN